MGGNPQRRGKSKLSRAIAVASGIELKSAIRGARSGDTIFLTADITMRGDPQPIRQEITIEGDGHSISGRDRYRIFNIVRRGNLTLRNLILTHGSAEYGGAILVSGEGARLTASECSFRHNSAEQGGGAICNEGASLSISECGFSGNLAQVSGGALLSFGDKARLEIDASRFSDNTAKRSGGAIVSFGSAARLTVSASHFSGNSAMDLGGGAVFSNGNLARLSISGSSFSDNTAYFGGGAIYSTGAGSTLTLGDSSFKGNSADLDGGAIRIDNGRATLTHLTLAGNSAERGGGIYADDRRRAASIRLRNCILADNRGGDVGGQVHKLDSLNCISADGACQGDGDMAADPLLGDWVDAARGMTGYFPLQAGSPALGGAAQVAGARTDQLGNARRVGAAAIGAVELTVTASPARARQISSGSRTGGRLVATAAELASAIENARAGDTIRLTADIAMSDDPPEISKQLLLEGDGHAISGEDHYRIFYIGEGGDLTIRNLSLRRGWAGFGGAIYLGADKARLSVETCRFSDNMAEGHGGAIYSSGEGASLSVSKSSFSNNSAEGDGGAIRSSGDGASLSISGSSFSDNRADDDGGAVYSFGDGASLEINESSFSGNRADHDGGALFISEGHAELRHLTLAGNNAKLGGGIFVHPDADTVSLRNSILADNGGGDCGGKLESLDSLSCLIKDGALQGEGDSAADPLLGEWVAASGEHTGYFPLQAGSPALGAADKTASAKSDQLGNARPSEGAAIGAVELIEAPEATDEADGAGGILVANADELADAMQRASDGDTIRLSADIAMSAHPPEISQRLTLEGDGHAISGEDQYRIFVLADGGELTLRNLILTRGSADRGGAIYIKGDGARLSVDQCSFTNNTSKGGGGAIESYGRRASLRIAKSSFSGNVAESGGAISSYGSGASLRVSDSSFSENTADDTGGAIYILRGRATLTHLTLAGNSARKGGGIFAFVTVHLRNCILANNSGGDCGGDIDKLKSRNSIIGDGAIQGEGDIAADPMLGEWVAAGGYFPLLPGSPALGAAAQSASTETDQLGNARLSRAAIGAVELLADSDRPARPAPPGPQSGRLVADARELASAIRRARDGDTIRLSADIAMSDDPPEISGRISIEGDGHGISGEGKHRIFVVGARGDLTIRNLRMSRGRARAGSALPATDVESADLHGGAVFCIGKLAISKCSFSDNAAEGSGGAIYSHGEKARISIDDSAFSDNRADGEGGAIVSLGDASSLSVAACRFNGNVAQGVVGGGAIYASGAGARLAITGSGFSGNSTAGVVGGGAVVSRGEASIKDCRFSENEAAAPGGALVSYGDDSSLVLVMCSFSGNSAERHGGAVLNHGDRSSLAISKSSFSGNSAALAGGAIVSGGAEASLTVSDSSFSGNSALADGGAFYIHRGNATLTHLTLAGNSARDGGGIFLGRRLGSLRLRNSILADNRGGNCGGTLAKLDSLNCVVSGGGLRGLSHIAADPMLGDWVEASADSSGYFPLLAGSPAIGAAAQSASTKTDQLGNARPARAAAIGAVEPTAEADMAPAQATPSGPKLVATGAELARAIGSAKAGDRIRLTADIALRDHPPEIKKRISIDGDGHSISGEGQYRIFVVAAGGDLRLRKLLLTRGSADQGGAILVSGDGASLKVSECRFTDNGSAGSGGAISSAGVGADLSISQSSFSGNAAQGSGGAIDSAGSRASLRVESSSFSGGAAEKGGAINSSGSGGSLRISNSSFQGNQASDEGGALCISQGSATLTHLTLAGNAAKQGGGICAWVAVQLRNSILADNSGGDTGGNLNHLLSLNCIIKDGSRQGESDIAGDPMLGEWVEASSAATGHFPLQAGSPALGAAALSVRMRQDQLGNARPAGAAAIGAVELKLAASVRRRRPAPAKRRETRHMVATAAELAAAIQKSRAGDTIRLTADFAMMEDPPEIKKRITIDGDGHSISGESQYRIFVLASGADLTIRNLTLTRGSADKGGAIYLNGDGLSLKARNCRFTGNSAHRYGGAIASDGEELSLSLTESGFSDNSADDDGGAIYSESCSANITISKCGFTNNAAPGYCGGAICSGGDGAGLTISASSFTGNSADDAGGAIHLRGDATSLSMSGSSFSGNSAKGSGGAICSFGDGASLSISDSSFNGNSAVYFGGAIYIHEGRATLTHLTLAGNAAKRGGGIFVYVSVQLRNSILADNSGGDCVGRLDRLSSQNCLIKDGSFRGRSDITADPLLGDWVAPSDGKTGYFPLLAGSPALGAADERVATDKDQLGKLRPPGSTSIGAVEPQ